MVVLLGKLACMSKDCDLPRVVEYKLHLVGMDKPKQVNKVCRWLPATENKVASCSLI